MKNNHEQIRSFLKGQKSQEGGGVNNLGSHVGLGQGSHISSGFVLWNWHHESQNKNLDGFVSTSIILSTTKQASIKLVLLMKIESGVSVAIKLVSDK